MSSNVISVEFIADISDVISAVERIIESVSSVGDISGVVGELSSSFSDASSMADELASSVESVGTSGANASEAAAAISEISTAAQEVATEVSSDMASVGESLSGVGEEASGLSDEIAGDGGGISGFVSTVQSGLSTVSQLFTDAIGAVQEYAAGVSDNLASAGDSIMSYSEESVANMQSAGSGFSGAISGIQGGLSSLAMPFMTIQMGAQMTSQAFQQATGPFGDFQEQMTQLVTGAGESNKNLGMVSDGIKKMSTQTGESTTDLSAGMYMIESAGYHGASGLTVLKAAAEGAKVGNASLADVANGVTTAMTDYSSSGLTAAQATNTLTATVAAGKTHMGDLSNALATILPTASAVGVKFTDVMGAMATMTGEGVPAADAATYLRQTLMSLENPGTKAAATMKAVGLSSSGVAAEMKKSLPGALEMITDALKKKFPVGSQAYNAALATIAGGTKQMQGLLDLTGSHMKTYDGNVKQISESVKKGGSNITGWNAVQGDFNQKMAQAAAAANVMWINIGQNLAPAILNLMSAAQSAGQAIGGFMQFLSGSSAGAIAIKLVLIALGGAILGFVASAIPALVTGFIAWATTAWAAAAGTIAAAAPFILIGAAIALLAAGIYLLITHWGQVVAFMKGVWIAFSSWFMGALHAVGSFFASIWNGIVSFITGVWTNIVNFVKSHALLLLAVITGPIGAIVILIVTHWTQIVSFLTVVWTGIVSLAKTLWTDLVNGIMSILSFLGGLVQAFWAREVSGWTNLWNGTVRIVQNMWTSITGFFTNAWSGISTALAGLLSGITGWFTNLGSQALQWGKDLIQNLINGITSMVGNLTSTVGGIAHNIASFLHFSKPDQGELANADQWMPDFVDMLTGGLKDGTPLVTAAMTHLVEPIAAVGSGTATSAATGGPSQASGTGEVHVHNHIYLNGQEVTNQLMQHAASEIRRTGPVRRAA